MSDRGRSQEERGKYVSLFLWLLSGLVLLVIAALAIAVTLTAVSLCAMGVGWVLKWLLGVTSYQGAVMALGSALVVIAVMLSFEMHRGFSSTRELMYTLFSDEDDDLDDESDHDYDDDEDDDSDDGAEEDDEDVELDLWERLREIECRYTISDVRSMILNAKSSKRAEPDKVLNKVLRGVGPARSDERQRFVKAFMKYWHVL